MNRDRTPNFDSVLISWPDGRLTRVTAAEFFQIPFSERIVLVSQGRCGFFLNGDSIRATEALRKTPVSPRPE